MGKYTLEDVKEYIENNGYELLSSEYEKVSDYITVKCDKGHIYDTKFANFQQGKRCSYCKRNHRLTYEEVKLYIESFGEKLISKEYKNNRTKLIIQCKKGHIYECSLDNFKKGNRCPQCRTSKGEIKIEEYLMNHNVKYKKQYKFKDCKFKRQLPFDFYLPDYNILIEFDGLQHCVIKQYFGGYEGFVDTKIRDTIKNIYCKENNIKLIRISYNELKNINNILNKELNV